MSNTWNGAETLALAFDIGTTQSAVSITHLYHGHPIKVKVVNRWPSSPNSSKVPSVILYDSSGKAQAFGAETKDDVHDGKGFAECKWFKLHLHPMSMPPPAYEAIAPTNTASFFRRTAAILEPPSPFEIPPLPPKVTIEQIYSEFFKYLFDNAKAWFETNTPDGEGIWKRLGAQIKLVVAHPNSWSVNEQGVLKRAIERDSVVFVTESEASVHFGLEYARHDTTDWLSTNELFAVVDAGGSTVDTCMYEVTATLPKLLLREAKTSDCTQCGAIFVSRAAEAIIKQKLGKSKYNKPEFISAILDGFETKTKILFDNPEENYVIKFAFDRDSDKSVGISRGRLTLTGAEVKRAFDPCVDKIISSLGHQINGLNIKSILLVGGFGESPYLQRRLRETFEKSGTRVVTADEPSKKAVAEGGVLFFAKDNVVARSTRFEFGIEICRDLTEFDNGKGDRKVYQRGDGTWKIRGGWNTIGAVIDTNEVIRADNYWFDFDDGKDFIFSQDLLTFSGGDANAVHDGWCRSSQGQLYPGFVKACTLRADLSSLAATEPVKVNAITKKTYKTLHYDVCVFFGGTSLRAEVRWKVNGVEHKGEASVIPSSFF
ncbi:hypothetical protein RQP46_001392 [Phenoliferia psychrophenolica]